MEPEQIYQLMNSEELQTMQVLQMTDQQRQTLLNWAIRLIVQNSPSIGYIQDIKYDGRLVVLDDGSRWEVDEMDTVTAEMWSEIDQVIVLDGEMFKLDDLEKVSVEQEF